MLRYSYLGQELTKGSILKELRRYEQSFTWSSPSCVHEPREFSQLFTQSLHVILQNPILPLIITARSIPAPNPIFLRPALDQLRAPLVTRKPRKRDAIEELEIKRQACRLEVILIYDRRCRQVAGNSGSRLLMQS
ncbi:unnamed protein product [Phytophthora fragariaefolia]|uniref:Unnamed protein product n=1 Tax=Phytophthora fragariaefolia TaxID=1490495 RepID=A0A9W7D118_9STRA|nr:unnamed protein product [Phytophthora fragariaefolia]